MKREFIKIVKNCLPWRSRRSRRSLKISNIFEDLLANFKIAKIMTLILLKVFKNSVKSQNSSTERSDRLSIEWLVTKASESSRLASKPSNLTNYQFRATRNVIWQKQQTFDRSSQTGFVSELCYQLVSLSTKLRIDPFGGRQCRVVAISRSQPSVGVESKSNVKFRPSRIVRCWFRLNFWN